MYLCKTVFLSILGILILFQNMKQQFFILLYRILCHLKKCLNNRFSCFDLLQISLSRRGKLFCN